MVAALPGSRVFFTIALGITLKLAFEPIECRKLSDVDGNIVPRILPRKDRELIPYR